MGSSDGRRARAKPAVALFSIWAGVLVGGAVSSSQQIAAAQTFPVQAGSTFAVQGHGNGHGHGLSQWGAQGAATAGLSAAQIVAFYYPHAALTTLAPSTVRVLISDDGGATTVGAKAGLSITGLGILPTAGVTQWKLLPFGTGLALLEKTTSQGWVNYNFGLPATSDFNSTADGYVRLYHSSGSSTDYRGTVGATRNGSSERTINRVPLDEYVVGVVPRESPSSWKPAAVQAQAIAARSYARYAVETHAGSAFDICDTTNCQVYGGRAAYDSSGNFLYGEFAPAIAGNQNQVLTYNGATIFAQFSASDGGWTVDGGQPYLIAQADPYDTAAIGDPWANWTRTVSAGSLASHYALASVSAIEITARDGHGDWGGRVIAGYVDGVDSGGKAQRISVTGFGLQAAMNLPHNWFTLASATVPPVGRVDSIAQTGEHSWTVTGWAYDPTSTGTSTRVDTYVGPTGSTTPANLPRPDVQAAFGLPSAAHGFSEVVTVAPGTSQLCVYAISADGSNNTKLTCQSVTSAAAPNGYVDAVTQTAEHAWTVTGWAFDPWASGSPDQVEVSVGGATFSAVASLSRPDVQAVFGLASASHGYSLVVTAPTGSSQLCVSAVSIDGRARTTVHCETVTISAAPPAGYVDAVTQTGANTWNVSGWDFDPAWPSASTRVDAYVGATGFSTPADLPRPDVQAAYGLPSSAHGFNLTVRVPSGSWRLCTYAISADGIKNTVLRCQTLTASALPPAGNEESLTQTGPHTWTVSGWAFEPAWPAGSTRVDTYVGSTGFSTPADLPRPDVQAAFGLPSASHGFSGRVPVPTGTWQVCSYAVALDGSGAALLQCRAVTAG